MIIYLFTWIYLETPLLFPGLWADDKLSRGKTINSHLAPSGVAAAVETQLESNSLRLPGHSLG